MLRERIVPQSEVTRAIPLEDHLCCGGPYRGQLALPLVDPERAQHHPLRDRQFLISRCWHHRVGTSVSQQCRQLEGDRGGDGVLRPWSRR